MKQNKKMFGIITIIILLLSTSVFASVSVYVPQDKLTYQKNKLWTWHVNKDVRTEQVRAILGKNPSKISVLPSVPQFVPVKNSLRFSNCGGKKLYVMNTYEQCVEQGLNYCNTECPKRYSKSCGVCNTRSLNLCTTRIQPLCNLFFKRTVQYAKFLY